MNQLAVEPLSALDMFNDFHLSFVQNPYAYYEQLPNDEPLLLRSPGCWVTKDYSTINDILNDKRFQRNFWKNKTTQYGAQIKAEPCLAIMSDWMLLINPPDHTRIRNLVAPFFSRKQIEKLREQIGLKAQRLIARFQARKKIDLISEYSLPLSMEFLYQILGIDPEEREELLNKTFPPRRLLDPPTPLTREEFNLENYNMEQLKIHVQAIARKRRLQPKDDLITHLLQAQDPGNLLSEDECISQIILLLYSGVDTVPHQIGNSLVALHQNPHQLALMQSNPNIYSTALHELLRYAPPVHMINMEAAEEVTFGNQTIESGNKVILLLAAGNRDPKVFPDPETLDLTRQKRQILSFSGGVHNCLGMHLGLALFEIGLKTVLQELPKMKILNIHEPEWNPSYSFRGLKKLMVEI